MGLSDDQRAMLRLLAQREEGYEDIAALKGMSVEEVRAEVKAALAELDAAEGPPLPPPPAQPTPAPARPEPEPKPEKKRVAPPRVTRPAVPVERRRILAVAAGALALVAVVIGLIALFGGDSGSSSPASAESGLAEGVDVDDERVTQAVLTAPQGGDATGRAIFGRLGKEEVVLQVTAEGLEPTPEGESYTVWLYRSPKLALRAGAVKVESGEGQVGARFPIPAELLAYIAGGAFKQIYVSRTSDAAYEREVAQAEKQEDLPRYSGETVLTGEITGPIVEAGQNLRNRGGGGNRGGGNKGG